MAITTYTAGEVLTAASLNNNFASGGLQLVKTQTIGTTVASVAVTGAFSSTFDAYKIVITGGVGSTDIDLAFQLGSTTTGYYNSLGYVSYANTQSFVGSANQANWLYCGSADTGNITSNFDVIGPNLAKKTVMNGQFIRMTTGGIAGASNSFVNNTTQYTGFTIICSTGTLTGGTIRIYGYVNS